MSIRQGSTFIAGSGGVLPDQVDQGGKYLMTDGAVASWNDITVAGDYVIESKLPTELDQSWYRLYKSGWCEQGGLTSANTTAISFKYVMKDGSYFHIVKAEANTTSYIPASNEYITAKTANGMTLASGTYPVRWYICGVG